MNHTNISLNKDFLFKATLIVVLWSTPPLVSRLWVGSGVFPGFFFGFLRYLTGAITLFVLVLINKKIYILIQTLVNNIVGVLVCVFFLCLMILGQNFSTLYILGSTSSVLLNFNPTLIYLVAPMLFDDEKYSKYKTLGVFIASVGIGIVFFASLETGASPISNDSIFGYFLGFLSGLAWAGYSISIKHFFEKQNSHEVTTLNLTIAAIILLFISLSMEKIPPLESYTLSSLWGIVLIGVGAAAIAFTLYLSLVQSHGAITAGNIQFLIPLVSLLFAWVFLGEFSVFTLVGGILCALGVGLVTYQ
ncbi:MAG: DMT family transporter [Promethearchaeota archaeon]